MKFRVRVCIHLVLGTSQCAKEHLVLGTSQCDVSSACVYTPSPWDESVQYE